MATKTMCQDKNEVINYYRLNIIINIPGQVRVRLVIKIDTDLLKNI